MNQRVFGTLGERPILEARLASGGAEARVIEFGASLADLIVPAPGGRRQRVVLGLNALRDYEFFSAHMGAIAGRVANRIAGGSFMLDGDSHSLDRNQDGRHTLHSAGAAFGKRPWTILHQDVGSVTLGVVSAAGEAGFPGALTATCRYTLGEAALRIELTAFSDRPTLCNLTNHAYFKLDDTLDILDHELEIRANLYLPSDADLIPDGSLLRVSGTPYDFRTPRSILMMGEDGERCAYDTSFIIRRDRTERDTSGLELALAARLMSARSELEMQVWTSEPVVHLYDAGGLNVPVPGIDGMRYGAHAGLCLETQHAPDSPHLPHLPSIVLRPGQLYRQVTEFRFMPRAG
jgi:aldose 1-epimerase